MSKGSVGTPTNVIINTRNSKEQKYKSNKKKNIKKKK